MNVRRLPLVMIAPLLLLLAGVSGSAQLKSVGDGGPGPAKGDHLTVEMVTASPGVSPGGSMQAGLVITLESKWHVYWVNAGDSGEPPKIRWTLPDGITAGPMQFPIPERLPYGPLMAFGYEDHVTFPVLLSAAANAKTGPTHLDAMVNWLVCREVCIPGKAHLGLNINVVPGSAQTPAVGALGEALSLLPKPLPAGASFAVKAGAKDLVLQLKTGRPEEDGEFYPFDPDQIANADDQDGETIPDGVQIRVKRAEELTTLPATMHGLVKISDSLAYDVTGPVTAGEVPVTDASASNSAGAETGGLTLIPAVGLAFLGGIILNLMPCVFPVLFLKGLALVQSSGEERKRQRSHGLVYTLGILVSFWAVVTMLLVLRDGGRSIGWGFQLQSPGFIAVLACGLFFFALSLAGQFDVGLSMTGVGGELANKQGYAGSFFTGVLATVVATPCTAPLMGAAIGFALAQPGSIAFAVFTALGLGLAAPYLLLSFNPAWTRVLPKPGAWMEVLKQLTSVLLFGTVIWLAWVYGRLFSGHDGEGADHVARLLGGFLILAIAGWALDRWPLKWGSTAAALTLAALALVFILREPAKDKLNWQPYSQAALEAARAGGHPVFIDFTAAWCLSCQVNERVVLHAEDVEHELVSRKVILLRADWTQYDPEITRELASIHRSGVPTYVLYPASGSADVLPELLTKPLVLDAIKRDAGR